MSSSRGENKTKVWNVSHLLNTDVETKKPVAVYQAAESVGCLADLGSFLSLPVFAVGTCDGLVKLAAVSASARGRGDIVIGQWQAAEGRPVRQMLRFEDSQLLAVMDDEQVGLWRYSIAEDGVTQEILQRLATG